MKNLTGHGDDFGPLGNPDGSDLTELPPIYREPTKEPDMNPEATLPWDKSDDDIIYPKPNKDQNEPSMEDTLIQAVLRIISLNCHLTIMFHDQGSSVFMDKDISTELVYMLCEIIGVVEFVKDRVIEAHEPKDTEK